MTATAIECLVAAIGYPERPPGGAMSFTLQVDGADVLAEERGGRLRLSLTLSTDETQFPQLASYAAGRILKEEATLSAGEASIFLWQDAPADSDGRVFSRLFETFMDSCDWWRARIGERSGGEGLGASEMFMIRP